MRSLFWRLFLINGLVFVVGTLVLAFAPVTVSSFINPAEIPVLAVGLVVILTTNALLVRAGLRRLDAEYLASGALAVAAQEGERQRISRELHDEIGQSLTVALLSLRRVADRAPEELREETELAQQAVRKSLDDVRQVARRLRPGVLADLGLRSALKELLGEFSRSSGVDVIRSMPKDLPPLGREVELVVYRVAQEALVNVARHAHATSVRVTLAVEGTRLTLLVSDNGHGGSYPEGVGIRGMRERAALVSAEFSLGPNSGGGTDVRLSIPDAVRGA